MNALLSIKPEFAEKILRHEKEYEFRKTSFSRPSEVNRVFLYASSPTQEIVGYFTIGDVEKECPEVLWRQYGSESGINEQSRFMNYFSGVDSGYAIEIQDTHRLSQPIDPQACFEDFRPPVSFQYVDRGYDFILGNQTTLSGSD